MCYPALRGGANGVYLIRIITPGVDREVVLPERALFLRVSLAEEEARKAVEGGGGVNR